jgi:cell division inhibitor SepF
VASSLVGKILNLMGFEETVIEEEVEENEEQLDLASLPTRGGRGRAKVVGLPTAPGAGGKVVVTQPVSFDEAKDVADHLKNRRTVIVNLEGAESAVAQRIVDFVSGATFALNGTIERVGNEIFLFAPSNVGVMAARSLGSEDQELFSWLG